MIAAAWGWFCGSMIGRWIAAGAGIVLVIGAALMLGRRQGRQEESREQEAKNDEAYRNAMETRRRVEDRIRRSSDRTAADRLRDQWSRD
jgi:HAMP domain-containing protein